MSAGQKENHDMATVTVYSAARMKQIEDTTVVGGTVDGSGNLLLETREGTLINAGKVEGPKGDKGDTGEVTQAQLDAVTLVANTASSTATAAQSAANSALAIAESSKVISRGTQKSGALTCEWLRMTNGIQMIWGVYSAETFGAFAPSGLLYTGTVPIFILMPFWSAMRPVISVGEAAHSAFAATWGQVEFAQYNAFNIRLWSAGARGAGLPIFVSYFGIGYYKAPTV